MRQHVDDPGLPQILDQIVDVVAAGLSLDVNMGVGPEQKGVDGASVVRKAGGNLFADQEVWVVPEGKGPSIVS
jgi:hypothetical protein